VPESFELIVLPTTKTPDECFVAAFVNDDCSEFWEHNENTKTCRCVAKGGHCVFKDEEEKKGTTVYQTMVENGAILKSKDFVFFAFC
jgi:hypothetical protein